MSIRALAIVGVVFTLQMRAYAATRYVDGSVASSGNGQSWATAWKGINDITGLSAGDTVYFSGGSASQTYTLTGNWAPAGGTSGNPITYAVGQGAGHNGTVIFSGGGTVGTWIYVPGNWVTIDGNVGGARHMTVQSFTGTTETVVAQNTVGLVIKYINFPHQDSINVNGSSSQFEIAYNDLYSSYDHCISFNGPGASIGFGVNKIHHNTITLDQKNDGSGWGSDGLQNGNSMDIYNNWFIGNKVASYPSGQHQDGVQTDGPYTRIYDNTFQDIGNYAVFFEIYGNTGPMQVWNNTIFMSDTRYAGGGQQAIAIGRSGGASGTVTFSNILVANNTIANYGNVAVSMTPGPQSTWNSTDQFYNNLAYDTAGFQIDGNVAGASSNSNLSISVGAGNLFTAYQAPSSTTFAYDFHLKSTATGEIDQGLSSVSTIFTTDHDGVSRPQGAAWDVGAYEYFNVSTPTPPTGLTAVVR